MWKSINIIGLLLAIFGISLLGWYYNRETRLDELTARHNELLEISTGNIDELMQNDRTQELPEDLQSSRRLEKQINKLEASKENREMIFNFSVLLISIGFGLLISYVLIQGSKLAGKGGKLGFAKIIEVWKTRKERKFGKENLWLYKKSKLLSKSGWVDTPEEEAAEDPDFVKDQNDLQMKRDEDDSHKEDEDIIDKPFNELVEEIEEAKEEIGQGHEKNENLLMSERVEDKKHGSLNPLKLLTKSKKDETEPINDALQELTEQVSAIREYASCQQDRVEKLQDGYDWSIIRTFCIKIIRCIDNLEKRIERMEEKEKDTTAMKEIKDELIFALESSGVEQFEPVVKSDYRGQEKKLEAIKTKIPCDDEALKGKIAKVVRNGYRYVLDDENYKVVRTAQVQLYE